MLDVLVVLVANVFHELPVGPQAGGEFHRERLCVRAGVDDRRLDLHRAQVESRVALDRMQLLRVRMSGKIEPEALVESDRIDDQRVSIPATDRMPIPGRVQILPVVTPVDEDLAVTMDVSLEEHVQMRCLALQRRPDQPPWIRRDPRNAGREAMRLRILVGHSALHERQRIGQQHDLFTGQESQRDIPARTVTQPEPGEIRLAVR